MYKPVKDYEDYLNLGLGLGQAKGLHSCLLLGLSLQLMGRDKSLAQPVVLWPGCHDEAAWTPSLTPPPETGQVARMGRKKEEGDPGKAMI